MEDIKIKRQYTLTLNHMLKRIQKSNEDMKQKVNEIRELHAMIDNTHVKIDKSYTEIRKQKNTIRLKKNNEI